MMLTADKNNLILQCTYQDRMKAKSIPGYQWDKILKKWRYPLEQSTLQILIAKFPDVIVDAAVKESLYNHENSLQKGAKSRDLLINGTLSAQQIKQADTLNLRFFDHQLRSFLFFRQINNGVSVDFSEPGCGKTAVQIALIKDRMEDAHVHRTLIICPKALMQNVWAADIEKFAFTKHFHPEIHVLEGSTEKVEEVLKETKKENGIFILNFEKTWRVKSLLQRLQWDFVIVDESSRIKSHTAKQSKAVHSLKQAKYKTIMTGTPSPNSLLELFSQFKFADPSVFGNSFWRYRNTYFYPSGYQGHEWVLKSGAEKFIKNKVSIQSVSWQKDKCLDLPPLTIRDLRCDLSKEQREFYDNMNKDLMAMIESDVYAAPIMITKLIRLTQITSGFIQDSEGERFRRFKHNSKLDLLKDTVSNIPQNRKIIVWSIFHADANLIEDEFRNQATAFNGQLSVKQKQQNLNKFKTDPQTRIIVVHPQSGGMGLNLSEASYSIYYSMNYSYEQYAQSRERFNRPGQKHKMTEYRLIVKDSIDEIILKTIKNKGKINDFIRNVKNNLK